MYDIRTLTRDDLPAALDVIHKGFGTVAREFGLTAVNCPTNGAFMPLERLQADFERGDSMLGLFREDELVGFMQLHTLEPARVELEKLMVVPAERHGGGGAQLIGKAKELARAEGAQVLTIGIIDHNTVLKNWYARNGFEHVGTRVFEHLPFTVGFMACRLT